MSNSSEVLRLRPHIALLPSAGMGHLTPLLRLAASLVNHNCQLTLITTHPTVSLAETRLISQFLSSFPYITTNEFHLLPLNEQSIANEDPFFLQFEAISRSAHLLSPLLSTASPPLSALITDISLASAVTPITADLHLSNFVLFTGSASMLSLCAHFPFISTTTQDSILIPGLPQPLLKSMLPPPLHDRSSLFAAQFTANGRELVESNGIIINTFDGIEGNTLKALNEGEVVKGLPPVIPIGPLIPCDQFERSRVILNVAPPTPMASWLDEQEEGSVVYVNFGSRTAMSREQMRELGEGLVRSGHKFLWVVKGKKVDREDEEAVGEVVGGGQGIEEAVAEGRGVVVKEWVDQNWVLGHRAVGGL
ncbi:hypothetical protein Scep_017135 [Stephania cephalantha]|uniref:UDP-glycosyltransferase n=1 Tax=Stephania cephalantha TaxID=152367 RepID=A0AAP0IQV6_9MAGN